MIYKIVAPCRRSNLVLALQVIKGLWTLSCGKRPKSRSAVHSWSIP
jgi:hypothetical protein